jgi:hypothetical protein
MTTIESSIHCFCKTPARSYSTKNGYKMVKCGVVLNYPKIQDKLKKLKTKRERHEALKTMKLDCNMNLNFKDAQQLGSSHGWQIKSFPKCEHNLFAKLLVCHSTTNEGKVFWTCPVQYPNIDCGFFEWANKKDNNDNSNDSTDSESSSSSGEDDIKKTKTKKRKIKHKADNDSSCESGSEDDSPASPIKKKKKKRKSKHRKA